MNKKNVSFPLLNMKREEKYENFSNHCEDALDWPEKFRHLLHLTLSSPLKILIGNKICFKSFLENENLERSLFEIFFLIYFLELQIMEEHILLDLVQLKAVSIFIVHLRLWPFHTTF